MSTNSYPNFFDSQYLKNTNDTIYNVPTSPSTQMLQHLQVKLANVTEATRLVTLYAVPPDESADDKYAIVKSITVPARDYIYILVPVIDAGGSLEGFADSASAVNIQAISGRLHTP